MGWRRRGKGKGELSCKGEPRGAAECASSTQPPLPHVPCHIMYTLCNSHQPQQAHPKPHSSHPQFKQHSQATRATKCSATSSVKHSQSVNSGSSARYPIQVWSLDTARPYRRGSIHLNLNTPIPIPPHLALTRHQTKMLSTRVAATRPLWRVAASQQTRSFATVLDLGYSSLQYRRTGDQPEVGPLADKSVSKASNGIQIATYDEQGPVSTLAIVVKAGSRYESADAPGAAHLVKNTVIRVSFPWANRLGCSRGIVGQEVLALECCT